MRGEYRTELFSETPRVPESYSRLIALSPQEKAIAEQHGFILRALSTPVEKQRFIPPAGNDDPDDWRVRMYAIYFCYVYENFFEIDHALSVIEDLFLTFQTNVLNGDRFPGLAQQYAGCGSWEPMGREALKEQHQKLRFYYDNALRLLENWQRAPA